MKVGIIGASGKVARQAISYILNDSTLADVELVLHSRAPDKIKGSLLDTQGTLQLRADFERKDLLVPHIQVTGRYDDLKGLDIAVVTSGLWPSEKEKEYFRQFDNTGRLAQSYANYHMVSEISKALAIHSPDAMVLMVTNQSDMMAMLARKILKPENVLGVGGILDTARFKLALTVGQSHERTTIDADTIRGHIIGYHNNDMCILHDSISFSGAVSPTALEMDEALKLTKIAGAHISRLQKDFNHPQLNVGPAILPGYAIYATISAFSGRKNDLEGAYNVVVVDPSLAVKYGVPTGEGLSIPINISNGAYTFCESYQVSNIEREHLVGAHRQLIEDYNKLEHYYLNIIGKIDAEQLISGMMSGKPPQPDK